MNGPKEVEGKYASKGPTPPSISINKRGDSIHDQKRRIDIKSQ
jgi:hypothetical protein